jgi:hypothetical protein
MHVPNQGALIWLEPGRVILAPSHGHRDRDGQHVFKLSCLFKSRFGPAGRAGDSE